jgi:hypothetical protein
LQTVGARQLSFDFGPSVMRTASAISEALRKILSRAVE